MTIRSLCKLFRNHSVAVFGAKGTGKDTLFGNVIVRRKAPYVSNTNYGGLYIPLDWYAIDCGGNTYKDFMSGDLKTYTFPYPAASDIYIADVGVYLPAQYCNELNRDYKHIPIFEALSRHLGQGTKVHYNTQAINRCWDKLREQNDAYVKCLRCIPLFKGKLILQKLRIYERYDSAQAGALPWRIKLPLFANKEMKLTWNLAEQKYFNTYGRIKEGWILYRNRSKHDPLLFKRLLAEGRSSDEETTA